MKKLLLALTALTTLTVTLYGACTADVDMNYNKIEKLGNGTNDGDAVNYAQTLSRTVADVNETNTSLLASLGATYNVEVHKVGSICILTGIIINSSGTDITNQNTFGTIPAGFRPVRRTDIADFVMNGSAPNLFVNPDGTVKVSRTTTEPLSPNSQIRVSLPYVCL